MTEQECFDRMIANKSSFEFHNEYDSVLAREYFKAGFEAARKEIVGMQGCIDDLSGEIDRLQFNIQCSEGRGGEG